MDDETQLRWEIHFQEVFLRLRNLYLYPSQPPSAARLTEALASCEILRENISQMQLILEKGRTSGNAKPVTQEGPRTTVQ